MTVKECISPRTGRQAVLGYICKYVPVEDLKADGVQVRRIEPDVTDLSRADSLMHANICSFVRAALEDFAQKDYDGLILTSCCDSARRLYDTLCANWPDRFFYCLDLPRKINDFAVSLYEGQIRKMQAAWQAYLEKAGPGVAPPPAKDTADARLCEVLKGDSDGAGHSWQAAGASNNRPLSVGLIGARPGDGIRNLLHDRNVQIRFDMTCTGAPRQFALPDPAKEDPHRAYTRSLLNQLPCMRMAKASGRQRFLQDMAEQVDGLIYHTIKFCDIYAYEYTDLQKQIHGRSPNRPASPLQDMPLLKIETDATSQSSGQILTRLEAFLETLSARQDKARVPTGSGQGGTDRSRKGESARLTGKRKDRPMIILGIDSGSTSTNAVLLNEEKKILATAVLRTGAKSGSSADRIREEVLKKAGLGADDLTCTVSTGYGRVSIPFADRNVTEISCHAKGAHFLYPEVRTILDIGGQDSKAIRLDADGNVADFVMNDKCAAGTGRFLEMMARTLEVSLEDLGPLSLQSTEDLTISSMCTVFAESEVISLIAQNKEPADIAHGIHEAIVSRAMSLIRRVGSQPAFMMTGGVARNQGVIDVLTKKIGAPVIRHDEPEIVGALGAALFGLEEA